METNEGIYATILAKWPQPTCVELPDILSIPKQRSELSREAVALQAMLQPQLCNDTLIHAISAALAVLMQVDELGGKRAWVKTCLRVKTQQDWGLKTWELNWDRLEGGNRVFFLHQASTAYWGKKGKEGINGSAARLGHWIGAKQLKPNMQFLEKRKLLHLPLCSYSKEASFLGN